MLRNTPSSYGLVSRLAHWVLALTMIVLIALGWYLVEAGYYDPLYKRMLEWHQWLGVLLWLLAVALVIWHALLGRPAPVPGLNAFERIASSIAKLLLYAALLLIPLSGYLMSVAEDGAVMLFGRVPLPPLPQVLHKYADPSLVLHVYASYVILGVACLHALGALKHHFVDRNVVLRRMLRGT